MSEELKPMTRSEIHKAAAEAQLAFCLGKFKSYDLALVRKVEEHHNAALAASRAVDAEGEREASSWLLSQLDKFMYTNDRGGYEVTEHAAPLIAEAIEHLRATLTSTEGK